jgi:hypothetical protein
MKWMNVDPFDGQIKGKDFENGVVGENLLFFFLKRQNNPFSNRFFTLI